MKCIQDSLSWRSMKVYIVLIFKDLFADPVYNTEIRFNVVFAFQCVSSHS